MKKKINNKMITLARESRGLSQSDLAKKIEVTQGTISKIESGDLITKDLLEKISSVLKYPKSFFYENEEMYPPGVNFYRKHKSISKKVLDKIAAIIDIQRIHIQKLLQAIYIKYDYLDILDYDNEPKIAAQRLREYWRIPRGPIDNVTILLENAGIIVVKRDFGSRKFSAVTKYTNKDQYIIFINDNTSGDRLRFTLAHELGHIIMHRISTPEADLEANAFASEFLMPHQDIKQYLCDLRFENLYAQKKHWKVSMGALIERAYNLNTITLRQRKYLWSLMSKNGYKLNEPYDIPHEEPRLLKKLFELHFDELGYTTNELSIFFNLYNNEFKEIYSLNQTAQDEKKKRKLQIVN